MARRRRRREARLYQESASLHLSADSFPGPDAAANGGIAGQGTSSLAQLGGVFALSPPTLGMARRRRRRGMQLVIMISPDFPLESTGFFPEKHLDSCSGGGLTGRTGPACYLKNAMLRRRLGCYLANCA